MQEISQKYVYDVIMKQPVSQFIMDSKYIERLSQDLKNMVKVIRMINLNGCHYLLVFFKGRNQGTACALNSMEFYSR